MCILVVDDDPLMMELASRTLRAARFEVDGVLSAEAALRWLQVRSPRLVMLDAKMPGMDGFALLKILKSEPRHQDIPVVMLTGSRSRVDVLRARELGAAGYVVKPFKPEALLQRIQTCLEVPCVGQARRNSEADGEGPTNDSSWLI